MPVNEITAAKAEFALVLTEAGLDVYPYIPDRITPPVVIIRPGSPYLQPATIGNEYSLGLELVLMATTAVNEVATEALDALIEQVINALPNYAYMANVSQPQIFSENGADYLGTSIAINLDITI